MPTNEGLASIAVPLAVDDSSFISWFRFIDQQSRPLSSPSVDYSLIVAIGLFLSWQLPLCSLRRRVRFFSIAAATGGRVAHSILRSFFLLASA
jgi:hypothetical protein